MPETPKQQLVASIFEVFCDEWMILPAMHYRWNFDSINASFNRLEFGVHLFPGLPTPVQNLLADVVMTPWRQVIAGLGITKKSIPELEARSEWLFGQLNTHFKAHNYLLGGRPCLGDVALMGPFTHLARDPYPKAILESKYPDLKAWYDRMYKAETPAGELLARDQIPRTLIPVLEYIFEEPFAIIADTISHFQTWRKKNPNKTIPRVLGFHKMSIGTVSVKCAYQPYSQWMMQRPLTIYDSLNTKKRSSVDTWLKRLGGKQYFESNLDYYLIKENRKLVTRPLPRE